MLNLPYHAPHGHCSFIPNSREMKTTQISMRQVKRQRKRDVYTQWNIIQPSKRKKSCHYNNTDELRARYTQ